MYVRRLKIFLAMIGVVVAVWAARLAVLQIADGAHYLEQARENLINPPVSLPTERGPIVDRYNRLLAKDEPATAVTVEYGILSDNPYYLATGRYAKSMSLPRARELAGPRRERYMQLLAQIGQALGQTPEQIEHRRRQIVTQVETVRAGVSRRLGRSTVIPAERMPHVLFEDISTDSPAEIARLNIDLPGISLKPMRRRSYPVARDSSLEFPDSLAHVVGYEGAVSADDLADNPFSDDERRRYLPGDSRGLAGIERVAEATLRGWRGRHQTDRDGNVLCDEPAVPGGTVRLSIDSQLQYRLYRVLAAHVAAMKYSCGGSIVVINIGRNNVAGQAVDDGDILALVSYPSFDPNLWRQNWEKLNNDDRQALLSRAVAKIYPPGSIIKPAVIAAALHDGKVRLDETIDCQGWFVSPTYPAFRCWAKHGHGQPLSPSDALKFSCNVFCYHMGERLGLPRLTWWLDRFGCGHKLDIGLAEEQPGVLPTPLWIAMHRGGGYSRGDARLVAIGQGDLRVTPLSAANIMATIARNGLFVRPTLILGQQRPRPMPIGIDPMHMAAIRDGMIRVVNETGGTARKHAFMDNVELAGKTGSATASRIKIDGQWFPPLDLTDAEGHPTKPAHGWFAGFAPAARPTIAIACVIEFGMSGGASAGPMARDVVQVCLNMGYLPHRPDDVRDVPIAGGSAGGVP